METSGDLHSAKPSNGLSASILRNSNSSSSENDSSNDDDDDDNDENSVNEREKNNNKTTENAKRSLKLPLNNRGDIQRELQTIVPSTAVCTVE